MRRRLLDTNACVEVPHEKRKKNKPREINITLFDHNIVLNFWVKLLFYVGHNLQINLCNF